MGKGRKRKTLEVNQEKVNRSLEIVKTKRERANLRWKKKKKKREKLT
jgi:hypothetical protein